MIDVDGDLYATRAEAAHALQQAGQAVTRETIRSWQRAGHITPIATLDQRPRYRMRDIWRTEAATRRSTHSRRLLD